VKNNKTTDETSWASMVNTPLGNMFPKANNTQQSGGATDTGGVANPAMGVPGFIPGMMPALNLNLLSSMGINVNETQLNQLLAVQMVMSGLVQPGQVPQQAQQPQQKSQPKPSLSNNWRSPASARYPGSALRSGGLRSSGLKSSGLKSSGLSSGLKSASSLGSNITPRDADDIDPELLKDIPAWLRSLRLHKYTASFDDMSWQEMVELDDATLEAKGVAALGARRRMLKTFENVKKKMGMETPTSGTGTLTPTPASALPGSTFSVDTTTSSISPPSATELVAPHSAAPRF